MVIIHPTTHSDVITALSNQILPIVTLQNKFIRFMTKCLSSINCILKLISHFAITNSMSIAGKKHRSVIDDDADCNDSRSVMRWKNSSKAIENTVTTITKFIDIRDGYVLWMYKYYVCVMASLCFYLFLWYYLYIINY